MDCFRRTFSLKQSVAKARLYASARGVYDVTLNGTRLEDFILAPGMTDYRRRIQYQTYDVTALVQERKKMLLWSSVWQTAGIGAAALLSASQMSMGFRPA